MRGSAGSLVCIGAKIRVYILYILETNEYTFRQIFIVILIFCGSLI